MMTLEQIVGKIVTESKLTRDEVMAKIKEVRDDAGGMISQIGAASIVAYKLRVKFDFDQFEAGLDPAGPAKVADPESNHQTAELAASPRRNATATECRRNGAGQSGQPPQNHTKIAETIYGVLEDFATRFDEVIPIGLAAAQAEKCGILRHTFDTFIGWEIERGKIYRPTPDHIALVNFRPSRSTRTEKGGTEMGVRDIYSRLLNVQIVDEKQLWDKPLKVTGTGVREFEDDDTRKVVLDLENVAQKLALNATNADLLAEAWGDDYTKWVGKSLKLVKKEVKYRGKKTDSICVEVVV